MQNVSKEERIGEEECVDLIMEALSRVTTIKQSTAPPDRVKHTPPI